MGNGRILVGDIETTGLLPEIREGCREDIHIIHLKDVETGELFTFFDDFEDRLNAVWLDDYEEGFKAGDILDGVEMMEECNILIFQNIAGFDALALEKTVGFHRNHFEKSDDSTFFPFKTADTLVMSQLLNPERKLHPAAYALGLGNIGPHSIAAHGIRIGRHKPEHDDWTHLSPEMIHRCREDVSIGEDFFFFLMKEWDMQIARPNNKTGNNISDAYLCELRMAFSMARQAQRGFAIDVGYIQKLIVELDEKIEKTEAQFRPHMPPRLKMKKLPDQQVENNANKMYEAGASSEAVAAYENYMYNGEQRASYAATNWNITTKAGKYSKLVTKYVPEAIGYMQDHGDNPPVAGPFTPLIYEDVPLGNRDAVKQILYKYGWRGVNYNDAEIEYMEENDGELPKEWAGKIDDDSLAKWEESDYDVPEWCKGIASWYIYTARRTQLLNKKDPEYYKKNKKWPRLPSGKHGCRGILPQAINQNTMETAVEYFESTGHWPTEGHWRVPAVAFPCATNTHRMRHKVVVNIPTRGLYGKEMRRCFKAGPGKMMLGCDASGLELRMLAHFMNDPEYTRILLEEDIHIHNMHMSNMPSRDRSKKFIYMFLYGSGIPNLARTCGTTNETMGRSVSLFRSNLPKLDNLMKRVEAAAAEYGYLLSVDGRWGRVREKHGKLALNTALNVLLQMTGSLVMKHAHIIAEDMAVSEGIIKDIKYFPIVVHQHDEGQMEIPESEVDFTTYGINPEDWETEEKAVFKDQYGRIWSAPEKANGDELVDGQLILIRRYHPIGDIYCRALEAAGKKFKLRCPTAGEYKIGHTWEETH